METAHILKIGEIVKQVVGLLVEKRFEKLDAMCPGSQSDAKSLLYWLNEYNQTLVMPPDEAFQSIECVDIDTDIGDCVGEPFPEGHACKSR